MAKLRRLEDFMDSIPVILNATIGLIDALAKMNAAFTAHHLYDKTESDGIELTLYYAKVRVCGYQSSTESMRNRLKGLIQLVRTITSRNLYIIKLRYAQVADTLSLRNQASTAESQKLAVNHQKIARNISDRVLILTQNSVDDNSVVRLVTLVTLFYLPASFVAVSWLSSSRRLV